MKIYPWKISEIRYLRLFLSDTLHVSYLCFVKQAPGELKKSKKKLNVHSDAFSDMYPQQIFKQQYLSRKHILSNSNVFEGNVRLQLSVKGIGEH